MPLPPQTSDPRLPTPPAARRWLRLVILFALLLLALFSIWIIDRGVFQTRQPGVATRPLEPPLNQ